MSTGTDSQCRVHLLCKGSFTLAPFRPTLRASSCVVNRSVARRPPRPDAQLRENEEPYCWTGTRGDVSELLASHVIHPNKMLHSKQEWDFAQTVNPPAVGLEFSRKQSSLAVESFNDSRAYNEDTVFPFWCET